MDGTVCLDGGDGCLHVKELSFHGPFLTWALKNELYKPCCCQGRKGRGACRAVLQRAVAVPYDSKRSLFHMKCQQAQKEIRQGVDAPNPHGKHKFPQYKLSKFQGQFLSSILF